MNNSINKDKNKKLNEVIVIYGNYERELGEVLARQKFYKDDKFISDALHHYDVHLHTQINYAFNAILNIIEERTEEDRYPESLDDVIKLESKNNEQ